MDRSTKDSRQAEYLKSKIRIPKSKIWFLKFLFRSDWILADGGGDRTCRLQRSGKSKISENDGMVAGVYRGFAKIASSN